MTDKTANPIVALTALGLAALAPAPAAGQAADVADPVPRPFTVEVIVFRYADSVSAGSEVFVPDPPPEPEPIPEFGDESFAEPAAVEPVPIGADGAPVALDEDGNPIEDELPAEPRANYVLLPYDALTMFSTWDRLDRIDAYEPLAHFGWYQVVEPFGEPVAIPLAELTAPPVGLDGDFTLYLSRFLHLAVALELAADPDRADPADAFTPGYRDERFPEPVPRDPYADGGYAPVTGPTYYRITEDRIFKSGDLRYFDHPRFGVLVKIERVEEPDSEDPEESAAPAAAP